jgi:divalent metal cation (Fe/Co/Zn/Cd) transporter
MKLTDTVNRVFLVAMVVLIGFSMHDKWQEDGVRGILVSIVIGTVIFAVIMFAIHVLLDYSFKKARNRER